MEEEKEYELTSTDLVYTPGFMRWIVNMVNTGSKKKAKHILKEGWSALSDKAINNLLSGKYTEDLDKQSVIVKG